MIMALLSIQSRHTAGVSGMSWIHYWESPNDVITILLCSLQQWWSEFGLVLYVAGTGARLHQSVQTRPDRRKKAAPKTDF